MFRAAGSWLQNLDAQAAQKAAAGESALDVALDVAREAAQKTAAASAAAASASSAASAATADGAGGRSTGPPAPPVPLGPLARRALAGTGAGEASCAGDAQLRLLRRATASLDAAGGLSGAWPRPELQGEWEECLRQVRPERSRRARFADSAGFLCSARSFPLPCPPRASSS